MYFQRKEVLSAEAGASAVFYRLLAVPDNCFCCCCFLSFKVQMLTIVAISLVPVVACGSLYSLGHLHQLSSLICCDCARNLSKICYHLHQHRCHTPRYQHCHRHPCHWNNFSEDLIPLIFLVHLLHTAEPDFKLRTSTSYFQRLHVTFLLHHYFPH